MTSVSMFILCASALFQVISARCGCGYNSAPISLYNSGCGTGYSGNIVPACSAASSGGALGVTTSSAIAPSGLSVLSENEIGGVLSAAGELPVLAAVALEGTLPTSGSAGTSYSCGNGQVGISSNSLSGINAGFGTGYGAGYGINAANANFAANAGAFGGWMDGARFGGCGCGRNWY